MRLLPAERGKGSVWLLHRSICASPPCRIYSSTGGDAPPKAAMSSCHGDLTSHCSRGHSVHLRRQAERAFSCHHGVVAVAAIVGSMPAFVPPHVVPPARAIKGIALIAGFLRNPLEIIPQDAYEQDYVAFNGLGPRFAWVTGPDLIKTVLLDASDKFSKSVQIEFFGPLLGQGILTSEGPDWKWQRRCSGARIFSPLYRCS